MPNFLFMAHPDIDFGAVGRHPKEVKAYAMMVIRFPDSLKLTCVFYLLDNKKNDGDAHRP